MSDAAAIAVVLGAVVAVAVLLVRVHNAHVRALHPGPGTPWGLDEHVRDGRLQLRAVRGRESVALGRPLDCNDDGFNDEVELARADARMRLAALNSDKRKRG